MAMNQRTMRPRASNVTYHAEALAWKTAAEANGGTVTTSTLAAVSTFCNAIDAAGIRDRFLRLNLFCGSNLAAARTPLYRGASLTGTQYGSAADVNNGPFVSGDYSESTGLTGNGTSKYLDTGVTFNTAYTFGCEYNNVHVAVYRRDSGGTVFADIGMDDSGGSEYGPAMFLNLGNQSLFWCGDNLGDYGFNGYRIANTWGFFLPQSLSGTATFLQNNTSILSTTYLNYPTSYNGYTAATVCVFAESANGFPSSYASGHLAAYSVGKAFTSAAQRTAYWNAMQAFQTALGRQV